MTTVFGFFQKGGLFMVPIGIVLIIGIALTIERWLFLTASRASNRHAFDRMLPLLRKKDYAAVMDLARQTKAPVGRIVASGIARMHQTPRREDIELAMEEGVMEALPRLEKRTQYLSTLANIATLLGLLGTIMGLIKAFEAVAGADPTEKATLLSQSIAVAMNTTAFGLLSAIPLLVFHATLQTKTTEIVDSLEMAGVKCLNIMSNVKGFTTKPRSSEA